MAENKDVELTSTHKNIKNTSTHGETLSENKLETGRKTLLQSSL